MTKKQHKDKLTKLDKSKQLHPKLKKKKDKTLVVDQVTVKPTRASFITNNKTDIPDKAENINNNSGDEHLNISETQTSSDVQNLEKKKKKHKKKSVRALLKTVKRNLEESEPSEEIILPKKVRLDSKNNLKKTESKTPVLNKKFQNKSEKYFKVNKTKPEPSMSSTKKFMTSTNIKQKAGLPRLKVLGGFSWDDEFHLPSTRNKVDSSSDESEEEEIKKAEKTKAEIRLEKQEEEKKIYEVEKRRLVGDGEPQSADDFDRLVLQSPDSSLVWTRYMAYHLECTEIDKARAVAERALKTISFRDEQEKLNMWVAYLNLENMYGTSDQLKELFERAKQSCDCKKIHERMISVYVKCEKYEEAEQLYDILVKKFHTDKHVWLSYVQFCFRNNRLDTGRKLLQRCFKSLEKKEHVEMISKVGQMEIKFGDGERGRSVYENLVTNYPKRLDLWSVYIDMIRLLGDYDGVRKLFERVLALKMNAKRMKFIFKKYLDFEKQFGTEDKVAEVKEKALKYVETKGYYDDLLV